MYGMQAVGCRLAWDRFELFGWISLQRLMQIAIYLAGMAAVAGLYRTLRSKSLEAPHGTTTMFLMRVSALGGLAALGAVAFTFVGAFWLSAC